MKVVTEEEVKIEEKFWDITKAFCKKTFFDYQVYGKVNPGYKEKETDPEPPVFLNSTFVTSEQKHVYYPQKRFKIPLYFFDVKFPWKYMFVQTGYQYYEPMCFDTIEKAVEYNENYQLSQKEFYDKKLKQQKESENKKGTELHTKLKVSNE